jgi:hypothetical protein
VSTRSHRGQFLGISDNHSRHIGTIRNLGTGFVSPQFHVIYDELFGTVFARDGPFDPEVWNNLFLYHRDHVPDEDDVPPELANEWLTQDEIRRRQQVLPAAIPQPIQAIPVVQPPVPAVLDEPPPLLQHPPPPPPISAQPDPRALIPEPEHEIVFEVDDDASNVDDPPPRPPEFLPNDPGTDDDDEDEFDADQHPDDDQHRDDHNDIENNDDANEPAPHVEQNRHSSRPNC